MFTSWSKDKTQDKISCTKGKLTWKTSYLKDEVFSRRNSQNSESKSWFQVGQFYRTFFNYFFVSTVFINELHYNYAY